MKLFYSPGACSLSPHIVLRELEGKTYQEIADITGCTLGTVKSRLNRSRSRFVELIGPLLD